MVSAGVDFAQNPGVLDDADASALVLSAADDDDGLLLKTCVDRAGVMVLMILEVVNNVSASVVAAHAPEDAMPLLEAAADAHVEVLVPPAVSVNAVSDTKKGTYVPILTVFVVLGADGDELLNPVRAEVRVGTGVDASMNPLVLEGVDASALVLTAAANDDALLLNTCADGVGVAVFAILKVVDDANDSVVAAFVSEDAMLLLEAAADAEVEVPVPPAVLVNAVSATIKCPDVPVFTALAVLGVDGDELLNPARAEVLVGTGAGVAMNPVVLDDVNVSTFMPTAGADDDALLPNTCVDGVGVAVFAIPEVLRMSTRWLLLRLLLRIPYYCSRLL